MSRDAAVDEAVGSTRTTKRVCSLCESMCGLILHLRDDQIVQVTGDEQDLFSKGYLCPKGAFFGALDQDPQRLRTPLVRRDGRLVPCSWEEAFAEVAEGLRRVRGVHGNDAVGLYTGNPAAHTFAGFPSLVHLRSALATKNNFSAGSADLWPMMVACAEMYGRVARAVPDLDRTSFMLIIGANPVESNGSLVSAPDFPGRLRALKARGGKLVVVDPRRTRTAEMADRHLAVRPATDAYLLLGLIHTLFEEGLVNLGRLGERVTGVEDLAALATQFAPEAVADRCGVAGHDIRNLARELAAADSACVYGRMGTCTVEHGTVANWLIQCVNILTGNLDTPGGMMYPPDPIRPVYVRDPVFEYGRFHSRVRGLGEFVGQLPMAAMAEEILTEGDGQVRALITFGGNPVMSAPGGPSLVAALQSLDFMVSIDPYLNETTRHASVVLPPPRPTTTGHYEWQISASMVRSVVRYSPPVFDLPPGTPSEADILDTLTLLLRSECVLVDLKRFREDALRDLLLEATTTPTSPVFGRDTQELRGLLQGRFHLERIFEAHLRLGPFGDWFGANTEGVTLQTLLEHPEGVDFGPLVPRWPDELVAFPDGRIRLAPKAFLEEAKILQCWPIDDRFLLIGRRTLRSNNSWMHNVADLITGPSDFTLQMAQDDADKVGVADGETIVVSSERGSLQAPVEVVAGLRPGVVSLPHGWGHQELGDTMTVAAGLPGANSNALADPMVLERLSGNAIFTGIPVDLSRPGAGPETEARTVQVSSPGHS